MRENLVNLTINKVTVGPINNNYSNILTNTVNSNKSTIDLLLIYY